MAGAASKGGAGGDAGAEGQWVEVQIWAERGPCRRRNRTRRSGAHL